MANPLGIKIKEVQKDITRIQLEVSFIKRILPFKLKYNVYAIKIESGICLFDCGSEETAEILKSALRGNRVTQVFLTHGHVDHAGSGRYWLKEGAQVFAPKEECAMLRSGGPEAAPQAFRYPGFEPTGTVSPDDRIALGGEFEFAVISTPGHTPGSVCYHEAHRDILISGDILFGPIQGYMVTFLLEFLTALREPDANIRRQIASLGALVSNGVIKSTTLILPGHGAEYYIREKPDAVKRSSRLLSLCLKL
ncbi:MAG: MBL fold metallo-hydrolase [Chloroflexi bacterium]|nr:MBL fold metallo-hydrolase [Chloroflexota bacterium]